MQQAERMEKTGAAANKESTTVNLAGGQAVRPMTSQIATQKQDNPATPLFNDISDLVSESNAQPKEADSSKEQKNLSVQAQESHQLQRSVRRLEKYSKMIKKSRDKTKNDKIKQICRIQLSKKYKDDKLSFRVSSAISEAIVSSS